MASDDFNRANADPIDGGWLAWGSLATCRIITQEVRNSANSDTDSGCRYSLSTVARSRWKITSVVSRDGGPAIHCSGDTGYFLTNYNNTDMFLIRYDGPGSFFQLGSNVPGVYSVGQIADVRRVGNDIIVAIDGVDIMTRTDTTYTGGNPGGFFFGAGFAMDDFTDGVAPALQFFIDRTAISAPRPGRGPRSRGRYRVESLDVTPLIVPQLPTPQVEFNQDLTGRADNRPGRGPRSMGRFYIRQKMDVFSRQPIAYTFSCDAGSYAQTGQVVGINSAHRFVLSQGTYSVGGQGLTCIAAYRLLAQQGVYSVAGFSMQFRQAKQFVCAQGSYLAAGQAMQFHQAKQFSCSQGVYALNGQQLGFKRSITIPLGQGSYSITGFDLAITTSESDAFTFTCDLGVYSLSGRSIVMREQLRLPMAQGQYSLQGNSVSIRASKMLALAEGTYDLQGKAVSIRASMRMTMASGTYSATGNSIGFLLGSADDHAWTVRRSAPRRNLRLTARRPT